MNLTFEDKLKSLAELSTEVISLTVKNPETQSKIGGYVGLGIFAAGLLHTIIAHNTQKT